jgi:geranylgeranylglycerol-phosphate geranylgeranyltransferase
MALASKPCESEVVMKVVSSFSILYSIVKSRTLVYAFALATLGTFLISSGIKVPDFLVLARLIISVYFLALATYLYNDLTDYDVDKVNSRDSNYSSKRTNYKHILYSTICFFVLSISLAFSINVQTGIASIVFLGLAVVYSHPKIRLKNLFVVKTIVTAAGGFIAALMGALAVQNISYVGISASLLFFLMYFINGPLGDMGDMRGDRIGGRQTIPIVLGIPKTFGVIFASIATMVAVLVVNYYFFGLNMLGLVLGLTICAYVVFKMKKLFVQYENKKMMSQTRTAVRFSVFAIQISMLVGLVTSTILVP